jgi:hypothetical protein
MTPSYRIVTVSIGLKGGSALTFALMIHTFWIYLSLLPSLTVICNTGIIERARAPLVLLVSDRLQLLWLCSHSPCKLLLPKETRNEKRKSKVDKFRDQ